MSLPITTAQSSHAITDDIYIHIQIVDGARKATCISNKLKTGSLSTLKLTRLTSSIGTCLRPITSCQGVRYFSLPNWKDLQGRNILLKECKNRKTSTLIKIVRKEGRTPRQHSQVQVVCLHKAFTG